MIKIHNICEFIKIKQSLEQSLFQSKSKQDLEQDLFQNKIWNKVCSKTNFFNEKEEQKLKPFAICRTASEQVLAVKKK